MIDRFKRWWRELGWLGRMAFILEIIAICLMPIVVWVAPEIAEFIVHILY